jgi:hypothetical protein
MSDVPVTSLSHQWTRILTRQWTIRVAHADAIFASEKDLCGAAPRLKNWGRLLYVYAPI